MKLATKLVVLGAASAACFTLMGWNTWPGSPKWSGNRYTVDLHPTSFVANSTADKEAQYAMADWRDMGSTSLTANFRRNASDPLNHTNGINTWIWADKPNEDWLAATFQRGNGSKMNDCDTWYNSRKDYKWTYGLTDPGKRRPSNFFPLDFRSVARHETGHAIGFDHEDGTLSNLNTHYTHGYGVPHATDSGMMPHATDKAGCRYLYKGSGITVNMMATSWREPAPRYGKARRLWTTGSWPAGTKKKVQFWIENQSNRTVAGSGGPRLGIYLSANDVISTADTRITEYGFTQDWPAESGEYFNLDAIAPAGTTPGKYYLGVIIDNTSVLSEQFETDNACLVGEVTITNVVRTARVLSTNPNSGVTISVSRTDLDKKKDGWTAFTRRYWNGQSVMLVAPATHGSNPFHRWTLNGKPRANGVRTLMLDNTADATALAEYRQYLKGSFVPYGSGCPGYLNRPPPHTGTGTPETGNTIGWAVLSRPRARSCFMVGTKAQNIDLTPFGMKGCRWLVQSFVEVPVTMDSRGFGSFPLALPPSKSLVGFVLYSQYAILDPSANNYHKVVWSNGLMTTIGGYK